MEILKPSQLANRVNFCGTFVRMLFDYVATHLNANQTRSPGYRHGERKLRERERAGTSVRPSDRVSVNVSIESFVASSVCRISPFDPPQSLTSIHVPDALFSRPRSPSDLLHRRDGRRQLHYFYPLPSPCVIIAFVHGLFIRARCIRWRRRADKKRQERRSIERPAKGFRFRSSINRPLYRYGFRRVFLPLPTPSHWGLTLLIPFSINYFFEPIFIVDRDLSRQAEN